MMPQPQFQTSADLQQFPSPASPVVDEKAMALLNHLRIVGLQCRARARTDLFHACAALSGDANVARSAYAEVLMRCLSQALGRQAILHRPREAEVSFDEAWLVRLAKALNDGDTASATFLLNSRVPVHARRNLVFLLQGITDQFSLD